MRIASPEAILREAIRPRGPPGYAAPILTCACVPTLSLIDQVGGPDCTHPLLIGCSQMMTLVEFWGGDDNAAGIFRA